jgi:general secretion pathway protein K
MTGRRSQRGLVLVTVLLVVAIAAAAAAYLSLGQQVWLRQVENLADRAQADSMRHAALDWIALLLTRELKDGKTDHLGEMWAKDIPPLPYEGGTIAADISDAQGRFNLNNLVRAGKASPPDVGVLQKLLQLEGFDPALAEAVVDWIDTDVDPRPGGAEDTDYLSTERPYRAANQALASVDELRLVKGFTPKIVEALRPHVVALPEPTTVNVNTASQIVLAALFPDLTPSQALLITRAREARPFTEQTEAGKLLPTGQRPAQVPLDVATSYFLVDLHIGFHRLQRSTVALINRRADGTRVLWHHPLYPKLPTDGEETPNNR